MRLVFMGTPQFAVPALTALAKAGFEITTVLVQPDRPAGRGRKTVAPPVKTCAQEHGLPVQQPLDVNSASVLESLESQEPDLFVVVAYGFILSPELLSIPRLGAINLHASLLPDYRGASPITQAILDGRDETGVSTMWLDAGIDTGDIIFQERVAIAPEENAGDLSERLAVAGAALLVRTVTAIAEGTAPRTPQDRSTGKYCRKLRKNAGAVDWLQDAEYISRHVRAMTPWPGAFSIFEPARPSGSGAGLNLRIERARVHIAAGPQLDPGVTELVVTESGGEVVLVGTGDGLLELIQVRPAGKRSMRALDWWRGIRCRRGRFEVLEQQR